MISRKMMTKILSRNFEKSYPELEKNGFKKDLPALPPREFFILLTSNHTVFLIQFGINLYF